MTPTPMGEGKTVTSIGLSMGLWRIGKRAVVALRQSSLGPTFGQKGGGAGGGRARIEPLEEAILHGTGDLHAVGHAHNQLAALVDNAVFHGLLDGADVVFRRVLDVSDRWLRTIEIGHGLKGVPPRRSGFEITPASELMAVLALTDGESGAEAIADLRRRIGRIVVAFRGGRDPIDADEIRGAGAATALLRDALMPTLMQTSAGTPALLHAGPFGNIAHGCSSILADRVGLRLSDYVVTEAGFGMDLGGEKFFDIKCRASGLRPNAVVIVATVRAVRHHSGLANLRKQIENARAFGVPVLVALNSHPEDSPQDVDEVRACGAEVVTHSAFADGAEGAESLARAVVEACERPSNPTLLYPDEMPIAAKIETIATRMYGAGGISFSDTAKADIERLAALGADRLPVCVAKTHLSLSHDARLLGAPSGFTLPIRALRLSAGAGFVYAMAGPILMMPGLGPEPAAHRIDVGPDGEITGLI